MVAPTLDLVITSMAGRGPGRMCYVLTKIIHFCSIHCYIKHLFMR
jgi:hypothetical protein